jgi:hypothetical protein
MRKTHRIGLSVAVVGGSIALVVGLVLLGRASEGPIGAGLETIGSLVRSVESRAATRLRAPGRAAELGWLEPIRARADSLRRPDPFLLGSYDGGLPASFDGVLRIEQALGEPLPIVQVYTAWGDRPDQRFPTRLVEAIRGLGSVPMVTWEPWLSDFENRLHPHLPLRDDRDRGGLAHIATGAYDFYIDEWARDAARFGSPLMVRLAHEMNDPYRYPWGPHNNAREDFIAAWRHVVERFRAAGAVNVVWVWTPHVAYEGWEWYYPGDDVVDWVGTGVLNYGTIAHWSRWWSFDEIFGRHYETMAGFGKPLIIAEFGSLAVGGNRAAWYESALTGLQQRYPQVRSLVFFHVERDQTVSLQALDWGFADEPEVVEAIRRSLGR